jgi:hypothetical protein
LPLALARANLRSADGLIDEGGNPRVSKGAMFKVAHCTLAYARVSALLLTSDQNLLYWTRKAVKQWRLQPNFNFFKEVWLKPLVIINLVLRLMPEAI